MRVRRDGEWIRCGKCGHKLGKIVGVWSDKNQLPALEIKCSSCKSLNYVFVGGKGGEEDVH